MSLRGFKLKIKPLEIITEEEIESIHVATLNILKETGVKFESKWALKFLKENDCIINFSDMIVRFPEELIEECIHKAPDSFRWKARDEKNEVILGKNILYFHSAPGMNTIDLDTLEPRPPTKSEYADYIRVLDALPNLHKISAYPYWGYKDVSPVMAIPESVAMKIIYSSKVQDAAWNKDCEIFTIKMAKAVGIEFMGGMHPTSPLGLDKAAIMNARRTVEAGFPLYITNGCTFGATSPATTAGSIVVGNAEILSQLVLVQLIKPGTRLHIWDVSWPMNMKTGSPYFGQIQDSIKNAMFNQIWRTKYKLPIANGTVGYGGAKNIGFQSGYERAIACIISAISGTNVIQLHGHVFGEYSAHPVQAILDDDMAGMVGHFIEGGLVNDETIALDLIKKVGPTPGHYLGTEHTRKWWPKEQFITKAADSLSSYTDWIRKGKKIEIDYAKEKEKEILSTHKPLPLPEGKVEEIEKILEEAKKYYKGKGML